MNGQQGNEASNQAAQEAQLAYLLNAAGQGGAAGGLMGFPGATAAMAGAGRLGLADSAIEEQILQRASALRAEALMQQQQQRQHQLGSALAALQQQQSLQQQHQLSALAGLNPGMGGLGIQDQEALYARAAALRELGVVGAGAPAGLQGVGGMDRLQQIELNRMEEVERRRQQLAALANLNGAGARPEPAPPSGAELQESVRSTSSDVERVTSAPTPVPVPSEKSKEDLRKTPGTVIVPCRARGMPMDHNFKTAYFVISEEAKHGEDLVCSYFACRNGGVKFRYCAYCMAPVAKRNFCRRHDHGMSKLPDNEGKGDDDESGNQSDGSGSKKGPSSPKSIMGGNAPLTCLPTPKEPEKSKPQDPLVILTSTATTQYLDSNNDKKRKKPSDAPPSDAAKDGNKNANGMDVDGPADSSGAVADGEGSQGLRSISAKRRKLWTELLVRRPRSKDPRHLSAWLNEVLTVSEFEIPLDQIDLLPTSGMEESAVGSGSSDEEKKDKNKEKNKEKSKDKNKSKEKSKDKNKDKNKEATKAKECIKSEEPKPKKSKISEETSSGSGSGSNSSISSDEKPKDKIKEEPKNSESETKSHKKSSSSSPKKSTDDGFAGSFADWRDRKKEKALKKGTGSLRK